MALVVTLSVFNGFHDLVATFFTSFDPQLKVTPVKGKTAPADDPVLVAIREMPEVDVAMETVEDNALAMFRDRQAMVVVKGVESSFADLSHITEILYGDGDFSLQAADLQYGIPGLRLAATLGTGARGDGYMKVYAPVKEGQLDMSSPEQGFVEDSLLSPGVVFNVHQAKYDKNYILTSINFARNLFGQDGRLSALELRLKPGSNLDRVKAKMREVAGESYRVEDRYEQQADTFRIMKIEKYIAYIFLTFILVVACFNIIGSLSMLIIDKKEDVKTLRNLGANERQIRNVFMFEGRLISFIGAVIGIVLGLLLCWLQQGFGLISLGSSSGSFVVDAYPVSVHPTDIVLVFVTVLAVGFVAVWYPVRYLGNRLLD